MRCGSRYWVLAAAVVGAVVLMVATWPGRRPQPAAGNSTGPNTAEGGMWQSVGAAALQVGADGMQTLIFPIPLACGELTDVDALELTLVSPAETAAAPVAGTVQVQAVDDAYCAYSHDTIDAALGRERFTLHVPLRAGRGFWRADTHGAAWSAWNAVALRSLTVRVFFRPTAAVPRLVLRYRKKDLPAAQALALDWSTPMADVLALGARFELAFDVSGWRGNPFDPAALDIRLRVTDSADGVITSRAFLYQTYRAEMTVAGETLSACGSKHLRVRYRPTRAGRYTYALVTPAPATAGGEVELLRGTFEVQSSGAPPAFVRVSSTNPAWFERTDGTFFYPLGWAILCPIDEPHGERYVPYLPEQNSLVAMRRMIDDLADAGGNCMRFWLTDWWSGLEWNAGRDTYSGLGRYNLKHAWLVDQILTHCEQRGIYVVLETLNHLRTRPRDRRYGGAWDEHPANAANGGPVRDVFDYWTDPAVEPFESRRLSYLAARYADSPAIHSWSYVSEADLASLCDGASVMRWRRVERRISRMLGRLAAEDAYGHPTGTHVANLGRALSFSRDPMCCYLNSNAYASREGAGILSEDQIYAVRRFSDDCGILSQPTMITEYGGRWLVEPPERRRRDLTAGLWAGVCSRLAGAPMAWWWNFIYGEELGAAWRIVADFMAGEDLRREDTPEKGGWRNRDVACRATGGRFDALMVGNNERRFLYAFNFETVGRSRLIPSVCRGPAVAFGEMAPGRYCADYWSAATGRLGDGQTITVAADGRAVLELPDIAREFVVKLTPVDAAAAAVEQGATVPPEPPRVTDMEPAEPGEPAGEWRWDVHPLLAPPNGPAAERCVYEATIALPPECAGQCPVVQDGNGQPASFTWASLAGGEAWRLQINPTARPPFRVTSSATGPPAGDCDERDDLGLRMRVLPFRDPALLGSEDAAIALFTESLSPGHSLRVARIEQVENPVGDNDGYIAQYTGPLFIPRSAVYTFAINSDDGAFVRIDGEPVVAWLGRHDMEVQNGPMVDRWEHRGTIELERGVHWLEFYHYDVAGAQLARLGWLRPDLSDALQERLCFNGAADAGCPRWETVPDQYFDGCIPCAVQVVCAGTTAVTCTPCLGLRLRRPPRTLHMLATRATDDGPWQVQARLGAGPFAARGGEDFVPVWLFSRHQQAFSLEWYEARTATGTPCLRLRSPDADVPLSVGAGIRAPDARLHAAGGGELWPIDAKNPRQPLDVSAFGVPLMRVTPTSISRVPRPRLRHGDHPATSMVWLSPVQPAPAVAVDVRGAWRDSMNLPVTVCFVDLWQMPPAALSDTVVGLIALGAAVLVTLDDTAYAAGLDGDAMYERLAAIVDAIDRAGGIPVLVLPRDLDVSAPLRRRQALGMVRVSADFGCRLLDLREAADE